MVKKASRKSTAAELLDSPPTMAATAATSPPSFDFKAFSRKSSGSLSSKMRKRTTATATASASGLKSTVSPAGLKSLSSISDIKELATAELESIKRTVDRSHTEIAKEFEASYSRVNKRFKMQMQTCQQLSDEADKDYKKMSERISETQHAMKASYAEFMAEAQASASRVCKTSIPALSQSLQKAIEELQSRYGTSST